MFGEYSGTCLPDCQIAVAHLHYQCVISMSHVITVSMWQDYLTTEGGTVLGQPTSFAHWWNLVELGIYNLQTKLQYKLIVFVVLYITFGKLQVFKF